MDISAEGTDAGRHLLPVLHIGSASRHDVDRLRDHGIGAIVVAGVDDGLRALENFRVAAIICGVVELQAIPPLVHTQTPVVLLAAEDADWGGPHVNIVKRGTPIPVLAAIVRRLVSEHARTQHAPAADRPPDTPPEHAARGW